MQITEIHVDFKATVSDGNYGNETYTVAFTATLSPDEGQHSAVVHLAGLAREHVYGALKHSPRDGIRYALETAEEQERRYIFERAEERANAQKRRELREQWKREADQQYGLDTPADGAAEDNDDRDDESPF